MIGKRSNKKEQKRGRLPGTYSIAVGTKCRYKVRQKPAELQEQNQTFKQQKVQSTIDQRGAGSATLVKWKKCKCSALKDQNTGGTHLESTQETEQ